jgi:uncharacterized protein YjbI with pentapeptide repeats
MLSETAGRKTRVPKTQQQLNAALIAHERYLKFQGGVRAQLAHVSIDGLNLANRNLTESDFTGASLVGANLSGSNFERASFYCADLHDCNLQSTRLVRADLRGASFSGAKLSYAVLDHADLRTAVMMFVEIDGISIVDRERASGSGKPSGAPSGVDFSNCSLKGASFGHAKFDRANFDGALLQGATFKNAHLTNVSFRGAVLTGVNLKELAVPPSAIEGAVLDVTPEAMEKADALKGQLEAHHIWISSSGERGNPAVLDGADLRPLGQNLVGRALGGLAARNAVGVGVDFSGSHLQAAKFDGSDLRGADFSGADLRGASFRGARLAHAKFNGTNLSGLRLANGGVLAPDLAGADATEEQFHPAVLEGRAIDLGLRVVTI